MRFNKHLWTGFIAAIAMFVLILDSKTAINGATESILLCFYTVIPALFPFFVISGIVNASFTGHSLRVLRPLASLCRIPAGSESLLLLGLIGGYPVGAKAVHDTYKCGAISKADASRLLRFCNNAGPSFIFGLVAASFDTVRTAWYIWLIQILSALLTGVLLPGNTASKSSNTITKISVPVIMKNSLQAIATVCGFVIIFRTLMSVIPNGLFTTIPKELPIILTGIFELTSGCCQLTAITDVGVRFITANCLLSFGGLCVVLQTAGVTGELGISTYICGKILQTSIAFIFATLSQFILFSPPNTTCIYFLIPVLLGAAAYILWIRLKNSSKISASVV